MEVGAIVLFLIPVSAVVLFGLVTDCSQLRTWCDTFRQQESSVDLNWIGYYLLKIFIQTLASAGMNDLTQYVSVLRSKQPQQRPKLAGSSWLIESYQSIHQLNFYSANIPGWSQAQWCNSRITVQQLNR